MVLLYYARILGLLKPCIFVVLNSRHVKGTFVRDDDPSYEIRFQS